MGSSVTMGVWGHLRYAPHQASFNSSKQALYDYSVTNKNCKHSFLPHIPAKWVWYGDEVDRVGPATAAEPALDSRQHFTEVAAVISVVIVRKQQWLQRLHKTTTWLLQVIDSHWFQPCTDLVKMRRSTAIRHIWTASSNHFSSWNSATQRQQLRLTSKTRTHTHTHTHLTALCLGWPGWAGIRKVSPIWVLLKKETVSGSGISWAICKSAPHSRLITTPAPHHSGCPSCHSTNSIKALKAETNKQKPMKKKSTSNLWRSMTLKVKTKIKDTIGLEKSPKWLQG